MQNGTLLERVLFAGGIVVGLLLFFPVAIFWWPKFDPDHYVRETRQRLGNPA